MRYLTLVSVLFLTACGTFQLASAVYPPSGKSSQEQQTDTLVCKDRARLEANTAERQAGAFLLGMTIIGAPAAYELERAKQREVFAECMTALGYRVVPATDDANQASTQAAPNSSNPPSNTSSPTASATLMPERTAPKDAATQLEKLKNLKDRGLITDDEYNAKRKEILDRL
jgi:hypothetical protein